MKRTRLTNQQLKRPQSRASAAPRHAHGPMALLIAFCLALSAWTAPFAQAGARAKPVLRRPVKAAAPPNNAFAAGKFGGAGAYAQVRSAAMDIMKRFPPGETVYIGVGRSPSSVMAYLKAAGGGGDDDDFGAVDFPVSGLGHNGSRQSTIDASWPAYQELFREFLPVKQVKGAKRLLLIDLTSGVSTENFRYAVRRFLHEEGINGIEIETFSLVATAAKGEPNTVASPFVFRGARVDHVVTHGVNGYAFGKENVAVFATGNVAGANTPTRLRQLVNPDRVILEAAIRENLGADAEWLKFLEQVFPHLLDPAAAEAQASSLEEPA